MMTIEELESLLPPQKEAIHEIDVEGIYIMKRGEMVWLGNSALAYWNNENVQIRRTVDSPQTYDDFLARLCAGEKCIFGVISVWKCFACKPPEECEWHKMVAANKKEHANTARTQFPD